MEATGVERSYSTNSYWHCPLYSFSCNCEVADFADRIQIKRIPREFAEHLSRESDSSFFRTLPNMAQWMAVSPYLVEVRKGSKGVNFENYFREMDRVQDVLFDLIIALKLFQKGRVVAGPVIHGMIENSEWSYGGTTMWTFVSEGHFFLEEPQYVLQQSDIALIDELFQSIRRLRRSGALSVIDIALRRFHLAYHGPIENRVIDQMIAFESLYLKDDKELTYKLALRTAFFLGKQRKKVFNDMKNAYALRGDIVHGNKQPSRDKLRQITPRTEEYLRQSIRKFLILLAQGKPLREIQDKLDENILKNGRTLAL